MIVTWALRLLFFVAALRDADGNIVNYLGVQCKVSEEYALAYLRKQKIEDGNISLSFGRIV